MASPNLNLRDPVIYRIRRQAHQMTGDAWCIYPMYDYTHCISDALEGITHSLCTLEFEDHRPLYDWILDQLDVPCHPRQIEFSRLSLEYTVVSKRLLNALVREGHVDGWDDPRMPTISALRRRGYTASAIRDFCSRIGVTKKDNWIEMGVLENSIREDLDPVAPRRMAVLNPLKVVIENYPEDRVEIFTVPNHPGKPEMGTRSVSFSRHLYIERDDFMEEPAKKFFRLAPGREVRLRFAYFISCHKVIKDQDGNVIELSCSYDPKTRGGTSPPDGRKVKGTIHWVSVAHAQTAEVRLYDRLFKTPAVSTTGDLQSQLNDRSLLTMPDAKLESALSDAAIGENYQFERLGYFSRDNRDSPAQKMVFNRTVTLRDTWLKAQKKSAQAGR